MILEVTEKAKIEPFLKKYFPSYYNAKDPFEKIVVYKKNEIIGAISYSIIYERAEINYIVVSPHNRNQKIGENLLIYALDDIKKNNCKAISLEVKTNNNPAINLYLKHGFEIKTIRKKYYNNIDAYLMVKEVK